MTAVQRNTLWLTCFAIAMAHVEASLVVHLRSLYYPDNPLVLFPLSLLSHRDLAIELSRELATVVMIVCVSLLAEKGFARIFAAFVYVFGLWDIAYYLWLKLMIGWPVSWFEWDVLFPYTLALVRSLDCTCTDCLAVCYLGRLDITCDIYGTL